MKVLFTGLGSIGQRHLRNLRHIVGNSIEVIAYREREIAKEILDLAIAAYQEDTIDVIEE